MPVKQKTLNKNPYSVRKVDILGVPFDVLTEKEALMRLRSFLNESKNHIVITPNPEGVMMTKRNPDFRQAVKNADLLLADGIGILLASRLIKTPIPNRVTGTDITSAFFKCLSKKRGATAYFLGAAPGIAQKARENIEKRYPGVRVIGCHHGYFNQEEEQVILSEIKQLQPEILLVCTGMPRAEIWAQKHRNLPVKITMCLGGALDIFAGNVRRAPAVMRRAGLEWLYRLVSQPSRAKRMLDLPLFVFTVLRNR